MCSQLRKYKLNRKQAQHEGGIKSDNVHYAFIVTVFTVPTSLQVTQSRRWWRLIIREGKGAAPLGVVYDLTG